MSSDIAITLAGYLSDRTVMVPTIPQISQLSRSSVNSFDRGATYMYSKSAGTASDVLYGTAAAAPFVLITNQTIRSDWRIISIMFLETWFYRAGTTLLAKGLTERFRPYAYNPDVPVNDKLISDYNPKSEWKPYIWTASLLTASVVGVLRYEAGQHYPSDILVGALVGSTIGYVVPWMHRVGKENITITPEVNGVDYGFSVQVKF